MFDFTTLSDLELQAAIDSIKSLLAKRENAMTLTSKERDFLLEDKTISAIKSIRDRKSLALKEAKWMTDCYKEGYNDCCKHNNLTVYFLTFPQSKGSDF